MKQLVITCLGLLAVTGCSSKIEDAHMSGQELFSAYCAACHKANGQGSFLKGVPANHNTSLSHTQISGLILGHSSIPDTDRKMPEFEHLSRQQADSIARYIKTQL